MLDMFVDVRKARLGLARMMVILSRSGLGLSVSPVRYTDKDTVGDGTISEHSE